MFTSIWNDIKREYREGNVVIRLIAANIAVFLLMGVLAMFSSPTTGGEPSSFYDYFVLFFSISSNLWHDLIHPWVFLTHQFVHENPLHILFNMLLFYYFGRIARDFLGNNRILPLFLLSGIVGSLVYLLLSNTLNYGSNIEHYANGASAAVMGVVVAAVTASPNYRLNLVLIGPVKILYIAGVLLLFDVIGILSMNNLGVRFTHIGGAMFGWFFIYQLRNGRDFAKQINELLGAVYKTIRLAFTCKNSKQYYEYTTTTSHKEQTTEETYSDAPRQSKYTHLTQQEQVDVILEKIKAQGYDNLTKEEKDILFDASRN